MCLFAQNWEIFAESSPIGGATGKLVHTTICYTRCSVPLYSDEHSATA
jgi:hypothetical protein